MISYQALNESWPLHKALMSQMSDAVQPEILLVGS